MAKIAIREINFKPATLRLIEQVAAIVAEYEAAGYALTLRQTFYQCVTRLIIPNKFTEYKRLGNVITDARYAGLIDWDAISDNQRELAAVPHWADPADMIAAAAHSHRLDKWIGQKNRVEVWVEKDALSSIVGPACRRLDVPYIACKGYMSASEMFVAAERIKGYSDSDQDAIILHFGDHDPSGVDMTRDIETRLTELLEHDDYDGPRVIRVALSMRQVRQYSLIENPVKLTDGRAVKYIEKYQTTSSWELDALEPQVLEGLIEDNVLRYRNDDLYAERETLETKERALLKNTSTRWRDVVGLLGGAA